MEGPEGPKGFEGPRGEVTPLKIIKEDVKFKDFTKKKLLTEFFKNKDQWKTIHVDREFQEFLKNILGLIISEIK